MSEPGRAQCKFCLDVFVPPETSADDREFDICPPCFVELVKTRREELPEPNSLGTVSRLLGPRPYGDDEEREPLRMSANEVTSFRIAGFGIRRVSSSNPTAVIVELYDNYNDLPKCRPLKKITLSKSGKFDSRLDIAAGRAVIVEGGIELFLGASRFIETAFDGGKPIYTRIYLLGNEIADDLRQALVVAAA